MRQVSGKGMGMTAVDVVAPVRIPLRDGLQLAATVYAPKARREPLPCVAALTPYVADHLHNRGMHFAEAGFVFVAVDVRGRGDSDGEFQPWANDPQDGYDVVEWLATQPFCNGRVALYGASYSGYVQWVTAAQNPPHLCTMVPTAAPCPGVDVPIRSNIFSIEEVRWQALVRGRGLQMKLFSDSALWSKKLLALYESGRSLREADRTLGFPSEVFQEYLQHPAPDGYWDARNPTADQYSRMQLPILTITGVYDGDQPGALEHYRRHTANAARRCTHCLLIGPWNHTGCSKPTSEIDGLTVGSASVIDMLDLHSQWYAWTLLDGPRPAILRNNITYYVMVADRWRYSDTLEGITARWDPLYLTSASNPTDIFHSGSLSSEQVDSQNEPSSYIYDPRDVSSGAPEAAASADRWIVDDSLIHARSGKHLIYHSAPFENDVEISGFFKLVAWISIDQPDTDIRVRVYEVGAKGQSVLLTFDSIRARYRESLRQAVLVDTHDPLRYEFNRFAFTSRLLKQGCRLRLVIGPIDSIYEQKNYNSGGVPADESIADARTVTVRLFTDREHPSALYVPVARPGSADGVDT